MLITIEDLAMTWFEHEEIDLKSNRRVPQRGIVVLDWELDVATLRDLDS